MSIAVAFVNRNFAVLGSESRKVEWRLNNEDDYWIVNDSTPKTHILANKIGLNYCGLAEISSTKWTMEDEIANLHRLAEKGVGIGELANIFRDNLTRAFSCLPPESTIYSFIFATWDHETNAPRAIECFHGGPFNEMCLTEEGYRCGAYYAGELDIIKKLTNNEKTNYDMSLVEAIDFIETTIKVGYKYLHWFNGHRQVSGGPVNIVIITEHMCMFKELSPHMGGTTPESVQAALKKVQDILEHGSGTD